MKNTNAMILAAFIAGVGVTAGIVWIKNTTKNGKSSGSNSTLETGQVQTTPTVTDKSGAVADSMPVIASKQEGTEDSSSHTSAPITGETPPSATAKTPESPIIVKKVDDKGASLKPAPQKKSIVRKRLEPEATKRLSTSPQIIKTVLTTTGRGENANWGIRGLATFLLTSYVSVEAKIIQKEETDLGEIKVVEQRTYTDARETLDLSEVDVIIDLDTLPIDEAFIFASGVAQILSKCGKEEYAKAIQGGVVIARIAVKAIDKQSIRSLLKTVGVDVPQKIEDQLNNLRVRSSWL